MSYSYTPEDKRTLAWCNRIRAKLRKKPVRYIRKGLPRRACECPLAKTIGGVIITDGLRKANRQLIDRIPSHIWDWIFDFDDGKLPHFIKGDTHGG